MKLFGIDTTTKFLSIGVLDGSKIYEYNLELGRSLSSLLAESIKRILDTLGWQASDVDYFACGLGPGSFTGTRIGLAAIKGLGFSADRPIVGISSLDIIAQNVNFSHNQTHAYAAVIIDAKRNLVYGSIYKNKAAKGDRVTPYTLKPLDEFLKQIKPDTVILGDALALYKEKILKVIRGARILEKDYWYPTGRSIVSLALEKIKKHKINNAFNIKPIYLYPKECQIKK